MIMKINGRIISIKKKPPHMDGIDGSRVVLGRQKFTSYQRLIRYIKLKTGCRVTDVLGTFIGKPHNFILLTPDTSDEEKISKIISHEFLHMVLYNIGIDSGTLDSLLRKKGKYDIKNIENGGI